ncbi:SMP-30/gluconolactonase/LRE family protein [Gordonia sp. X0973]|uniref:ABC transporter permease n=1 Tax=Gordonia sp. X0973 TaxID=2742602 RepID=UPI000F549049|nr:SMP-30/gluconolactonase/LRE family protein [Gordonia sp. X0973]QKT08823.1 SMP-30/gluconolactonase/LRE family protein [Gordonia sp. X0973]
MTTTTDGSVSLRRGGSPLRRGIDAFPLTGGGFLDRFAPYRNISELFGKRWMEGAVPLILALALSIYVLATTNVGADNAGLIMDSVAIYGLIAIGMTIVLVGGGIDLSVGSIVAFVGLGSLAAWHSWGVPPVLVAILAPIVGGLLGAVNGYFIAIVRMRPFITTLVTLVAFGGAARVLQTATANTIGGKGETSAVWDFLGNGRILGLHTCWFIFLIVLIVAHVCLTRSRWGWWVTATGSDRRSARRNGIPVTKVTFWSYVLSGALAGAAALIYQTINSRTDPNLGSGWEITVLTAVVLGGVSLSGGRGSVLRATVGVFVVAILQQATVGAQGPLFSVVLAAVLLVFTILDLKWGKYRQRAVEKLKLDPARQKLGPLLDVTAPGTVWTPNSKLTVAPPLGLGKIRGAEDCAVDNDGNVYCGDQRGWVWKFRGIEDTEGEIFSRTGGFPCGHKFDRDGNLVVAVGGIGVYRIDMDGNYEVIATQTKRSPLSLIDDSGLRAIDDLDVAPDGSIYCSDFSTRNNTTEFQLELVEFRDNGRIIRIDPEGKAEVVIDNYVFPNGIVTAHDGQSILVASTGLARVDRLWISGPKEGQLEPVLENLPGYPDNMCRSSDGNYWLPLVALRTEMSDLLNRYPDVRRRMTREMPLDNWIAPQFNTACVIKFSDSGEILTTLWDKDLENYPMVTGVKENDGYLYLCGVSNNRIGKMKLDPSEVGTIDTNLVPGVAPATTAKTAEAAR